MYDTIIIGGGPAGLSAAIYTGRKKLKTAVVTIDVGGQVNLTSHIENYPGVEKVPGMELVQKFQIQATKFGAEFIFGKVSKLEKVEGGFELTMGNEEKHQTKSVILAFGKVPRMLDVPGEDKFMGRGVSTCATCDGPLFKDKNVVVIGGGNSAVEAALDLSNHAQKVYLVHRRDEFRADETTVEKLKIHPKIELVLKSVLTEIHGDKVLTSVTVETIESKETRELDVDGVFLEIGSIVDSTFVKELVKTNDKNEIVIDCLGKTSQEGIFAAGDVTDTPHKQAIIAAGDGARAALEAYAFVHGNVAVPDWKH